MTQRIVIVGAGGHAKVVLEAVQATERFTIVGATDPHPEGTSILGIPILGSDDVLPALHAQGVRAAVVALGENDLRERLAARLRTIGFALPPIVHPQAFVAPSARIADGAIVMARAVVGTDTSIGPLAIINTGAILDHDNEVGIAAHIAPGCALAGWVKVGARSLVGVGSAVRPKVTIGADVVVGAGSAVVKDLPDGARVGGVPARPLPQVAAPKRS
ncbi:MAG: NeuD/PglB/VioB family sugar acetyltransferase [Candidatus Eremiobacteraeota bacterium]|nr:NeuD/PglB/VioB family sugar acetyltransferase [Candidatus Eremiobacteraeota bacterium]